MHHKQWKEKEKSRLKFLEDEGGALIKIEDSGKGITKTTIQKMFEPLYTTKDIGTGLGLSICKSIIEQHGGTH